MSFKDWTERNKGLWEFIKFNILSNVSTIMRFVVTWAGTAAFVSALHLTQPFKFLIFDYTSAGSNGLGGFLTFLVAEALAQVVNFFVQMKWVFKSDADFSKAAPKFAVLAIVIIVVNLILPGYVTSFCKGFGMADGVAATVASVVNTILAVVVSFPALKFWITPGDKKKDAAEEAAVVEAVAEEADAVEAVVEEAAAVEAAVEETVNEEDANA